MTWLPNKLERERLDKLERLRARDIDPFPGPVRRTHAIADAVAAFQVQEQRIAASSTPNDTDDTNGLDAKPEPVAVSVCGRVRSIRTSGKVSFVDLEDGTGRVQLFIRLDAVGEAAYETLKRDIDLFDFLQAEGTMMRTRTGEISVQTNAYSLLAKALSPLPVIKEQEIEGKTVAHGGFTDVEERFRQRYADLASSAETRQVFRVRARTINAVRRFLDDEGFLEVETPILQPIYGGAAARPFVTHHNQLHQDLFLRISFELYLKRLLVGMYDAVYEIGRDFRNEGVSFKHNPEFTMLEFYRAYADYQVSMDTCERMFAYVAQQVTGSTRINYAGNEIELAPPWRRWTLRDAIREMSGIDYVEYPTAELLYKAMRAKGIEVAPSLPWGKLIEHLLAEFVEPTLIQPTFILDYPRDISPFAKPVSGDAMHVQRFEFYINGMEMGNAFTELNDPLDQEERFLAINRLFGAEDEDAAPIDEDYLRAMRYGMPPNSGVGIGVDRIVMLMTDRHSIREVLLYPHLRERKEDKEDKETSGEITEEA